VALMGIERLVPTIEDLAVILQLLPRNATGQILTSYVTLIQGPGRLSIADGSRHRYLILIDNGRRAMHTSPLAEALMCIRCGACLNVCPVFQELGGHAYGSPYPGPIGSVVSPGLFGVAAFGHLAKASTLCGACKEACPIGIDIPRMLLHVRHEYVSGGGGRQDLRWGLRLFAWGATRPSLFATAQRLGALATSLLARGQNWLRWLPPPGNAWTGSRHFPPIAARALPRRWRQTNGLVGVTTTGHPVEPAIVAPSQLEHAQTPRPHDLADAFTQALMAVSGEVLAVDPQQIPSTLERLLPANPGPGLVAVQAGTEPALLGDLSQAGFELLESRWPTPSGGAPLDQAAWGIVWARAGLADSGTVVLPSRPVGTLTASLLPPTLAVILSRRDLQADLAAWLAAGGKAELKASPMVVLVTGPSRTSDIEMTLTLGVHGPGRLIVLLTP
jgi:L-lactate dehydrogenase complex protein LldF